MNYSTYHLTPEQMSIIDSETTVQGALSRSGEFGEDAVHTQKAYIATKRFGGRSVARLETRNATRARFIEVWEESQND